MTPNTRYLALFLVVVAPIGAVVVVSVLLLFGVSPHLVFTPGRMLVQRFHAPRPVGVITTVGLVWLAIIAIGLAVSRLRGGRA